MVINSNDFGNPLLVSYHHQLISIFSHFCKRKISKIKELNGTSSCVGIHGSQMSQNDLSI